MNNNNGALSFEASIDPRELDKNIDHINRQIRGLAASTENETKRMDAGFSKLGIAIGGALSFTAAKQFAGELIRVRGQFQQLGIAFNTMLGSRAKADALMAQIVQTAATTPFGLTEIAQGAKQLIAYGTSAEEVNSTLVRLGNIASGLSVPLNDLIYLYGTSATQGRLMTQDLNQFAGRGVPIYTELAKVMGVTKEEIKGLASEGKIGFEQLEKVIQNLTNEGGMFFNLMEEQSKSLTGQISNLGDSWDQMLNSIGESHEGLLSSGIAGLATLIDNYQEIGKALAVLIVAYGSYRAAVIAVAAAQKVALVAEQLTQYMQMGRALGFATANQIAFNRAVLANPYALAAAALLTVITAVALYGDELEGAEKLQKELNDRIAESTTAITLEKEKLEDLLKVAKNEKLSKEQRLEAIKKINDIAPEYLNGINLETLNTDEATKAIRRYISALEDKLKAQAITDQKMENLKKIQDLKSGDPDKIKNTLGTNALGNAARSLFSTVTGVPLEVQMVREAIEELESQNDKLDETLQASYEKQAETIRKKGGDVVVKNKAYWDERLKAEKEGRDALDLSTKEGIKERDAANKRIIELEKELDKYADPKTSGKKGGIVDKIFPAGSLAEFDRQISHIEQRIKETPLAGNEVKIQSMQAQLLKLTEARAEAVKIVEVRSFIETLEEKQKLYAEYEKASENTMFPGLADKQYAPLLEGGKTYYDFLKSKMLPLQEKITGGKDLNANEGAMFFALKNEIDVLDGVSTPFQRWKEDLEDVRNSTFSLTEWLDILDNEMASMDGDTSTLGKARMKELKEEAKTTEKELKSLYAGMLYEAQSYGTKKAGIEAKYTKADAAARKKYTGLELAAVLQNLEIEKAFALENLEDETIAKSDAYKRLQDEQLYYGRQLLTQRLKNIEEDLKSELVAEEIKDKLRKEKRRNQAALLSNDLKEVAGVIANEFGAIEIELNNGVKVTGQQISALMNNISNLFDSGASTSSQVGSLVGAINFAVLTIRDAVTNPDILIDGMHWQAKSYEEWAGQLTAVNMQLERQFKLLEGLYGEKKAVASMQLYNDMLDQRAKLFEEMKKASFDLVESAEEMLIDPIFGIDSKNDGWGKIRNLLNAGGQALKRTDYTFKTIDTSEFTDIEQFRDLLLEIKRNGDALDGMKIVEEDIKMLEEMVNQHDELVEKAEEMRRALKDIYAGSTAEALADSIVEGFRQGKRSSADFANDFQKVMQTSLINAFKMKIMDKQMDDFMERMFQMYDLANPESTHMPTPEDIEQRKKEWEAMIEAQSKQFDLFQQVTGVNLSAGAQADALQGAIQGMSEQTASILTGQFNAMRVGQADANLMLRDQLFALHEIASNTRYLISIDRKLSNGALEARAYGVVQ